VEHADETSLAAVEPTAHDQHIAIDGKTLEFGVCNV
jgi:hypothetical protein